MADTVDHDDLAAQAAAGQAPGDLSAPQLRARFADFLEHIQKQLGQALHDLDTRDQLEAAPAVRATLRPLYQSVKRERREGQL